MNITDNNSPFTAKKLRTAWCELAESFAHNHETQFVTLNPHTHIRSFEDGKKLLYGWSWRMNKAFTGTAWHNDPELCCEWIAFPEKGPDARHWHLLFSVPSLSEERFRKVYSKDKYQNIRLRKGEPKMENLAAMAHTEWKGMILSGTAETRLQFDIRRLSSYVTKEFWQESNRSEVVFAPKPQMSKAR